MLTLFSLDDEEDVAIVSKEAAQGGHSSAKCSDAMFGRTKSMCLPERASLHDQNDETLPVNLRSRPKKVSESPRARLCSVCWKEQSERELKNAANELSRKISDTSDSNISAMEQSGDKEDSSRSDGDGYNLRRKGSRKRSFSDFSAQEHNVDAAVYNMAMTSERYSRRRDALCDPNRMLLPQSRRESVEENVSERKRSLRRKISNFLTAKLNLDNDEDLF